MHLICVSSDDPYKGQGLNQLADEPYSRIERSYFDSL